MSAVAIHFAGLPVVLRGGLIATISTARSGVPGYPLEGETHEGTRELWTMDGRWLNPGADHARDIVAAILSGRAVPWGEFLRGAGGAA